MLMKSVPPVVVPTLRHRLIANPLIIPPNTLISSISSVKMYGGRTSTSTLESIITTIE